MSKITRLIARVVGAFFLTLSVAIHTAKWAFELGRIEVEGKQETNEEQTK